MTDATDGGQTVEVYLGTPILHYNMTKDEDRDPYYSKIGGRPAWLRPVKGYVHKPSNSAEKLQIDKRSTVVCPECRDSSYLRLLAQLHCPLSVFDRVLYLFMCVNCSSTVSSSVCCVRSQLFNEDYAKELAAVEAKALEEKESEKTEGSKGPMFPVNDDEDEGWDEPSTDPQRQPDSNCQQDRETTSNICDISTVISKPQSQIYVNYQRSTEADLSAFNSCTPLVALPVIPLDTTLEPPLSSQKGKRSLVSDRQSQQCINEGDDKLTWSTDDDASPEGSADDIQQEEYINILSRFPSQCVRWSPNGVPIHSTHSKRPPLNGSSIPHCSECGAPRVFEAQLLSPSIYFFSQKEKQPEDCKKSDRRRRHVDELENVRKDVPRYSTISIYTCSSHCYSEESTVSYEYCHVEPDI